MRKRRKSFRKPSSLWPNRWRGSSTTRKLVHLKVGCCIRQDGGLAISFARGGAKQERAGANTRLRGGQRPLNAFRIRQDRTWKQSGRRNGEIICSRPRLRK